MVLHGQDVLTVSLLKPLVGVLMNDGPWVCDRCGSLIEEPKHGWVEWLTKAKGERFEFGLRLVHHVLYSPRRPSKCQYDEQAELDRNEAIVGDAELERFLGPDGLMYLLSWLESDRLPKTEILELIRRLHIKGYELVRRDIGRAVAEGVIDEPYPAGNLSQEQITYVLAWLQAEREEEGIHCG